MDKIHIKLSKEIQENIMAQQVTGSLTQLFNEKKDNKEIKK